MNKPLYCTLIGIVAVIAYAVGILIAGDSPVVVGGLILFLLVWNQSGIEYDLYTLGRRASAASDED